MSYARGVFFTWWTELEKAALVVAVLAHVVAVAALALAPSTKRVLAVVVAIAALVLSAATVAVDLHAYRKETADAEEAAAGKYTLRDEEQALWAGYGVARRAARFGLALSAFPLAAGILATLLAHRRVPIAALGVAACTGALASLGAFTAQRRGWEPFDARERVVARTLDVARAGKCDALVDVVRYAGADAVRARLADFDARARACVDEKLARVRRCAGNPMARALSSHCLREVQRSPLLIDLELRREVDDRLARALDEERTQREIVVSREANGLGMLGVLAFEDPPDATREERIARAIGRRDLDVLRCYEGGRTRSADLWGRVRVVFSIAPDGSVRDVADDGSDLPDAEVVACVLGVVRSLRFDAGAPERRRIVYAMTSHLAP